MKITKNATKFQKKVASGKQEMNAKMKDQPNAKMFPSKNAKMFIIKCLDKLKEWNAVKNILYQDISLKICLYFKPLNISH